MINAKFEAYKNQDKKMLISIWVRVIINLNYEQIKRGCDWILVTDVARVPNIIREFNLACYELFKKETAYQLAKDIKAGRVEDGKHAVIREAMGRAGMFSKVSTATPQQEERSFKEAYEYLCDKVIGGEKIEAPEPKSHINEDVSGAEMNKRRRSRLVMQFGRDSKQVTDFDMFCKMSVAENMAYIKKMLSGGFVKKINAN